MVKEEQWAPVIVMLISSVAMGSVNALVKKALDVGVNHMIFGAYRMAISALILVPFSFIWERKTRPQLTLMLLCEHFISGLLGASLMQFFFLLGLSYTSATVSMALVSMLPAITFALALIFRIENAQNLKSKAGVLKVMGTLICIMGAMLLTFYKGPELSNPHSHPRALHNNNNTLHNNGYDQTKKWLLGCLYLVIGTVLLSLWMLFQGKLSFKYPGNKFSSTCLMSVFASFQCAILSLYKSRDVKDWIIEDKFVIFITLYAGIVGQAMSTVVTSWSIKMTGAVFVSTFSPVSLVAATLFDFLILHSPLYLGSILGSLVTITGLYVFLWGRKIETDQSVSTTLNSSQFCQNNENEDHVITNHKDTNLPV
ncbi:unnamed protein product [Arabidopsis arenosa]|uniref:WAT1-related protein n=1 Tax=Arabidopsis arenosa TaxID=38785 RepID=A0A8S2ASB2_ARAAE|nr:unnamed protein product [Arabidopsis arenosa]